MSATFTPLSRQDLERALFLLEADPASCSALIPAVQGSLIAADFETLVAVMDDHQRELPDGMLDAIITAIDADPSVQEIVRIFWTNHLAYTTQLQALRRCLATM